MTHCDITDSSTVHPVKDVQFPDIFDLEEIQNLQDLFSDATGIASVITFPDGRPITRPSNFCRLFSEMICNTPERSEHFFRNASLDVSSQLPASINGGLRSASAGIFAGDQHLANWWIGQVRDDKPDEHYMITCANGIGAEKDEFMAALNEVPVMGEIQFASVVKLLSAAIIKMSDDAIRNLRLNELIAENKKNELALNQRESVRMGILNSLNGFAYCRMIYNNGVPSDFTYLMVNSAFETLTGLSDVVGKKVSEVIPGICLRDPELIRLYGRVASTGQPESFEIMLKSLDNWFSISVSSPEKDHFIAVFDIISAKKKAEEALQESENIHRSLFENSLQGIVYQNTDGRIIAANPAAQRILGLSLDQMQGRKSTDPRWHAVQEDGTPLPGEQHPAMLALKTGKIYQNTIMGVYHPVDDKMHWITINASPVFHDGESAPYMVYAVFEDITERKQIEEQLRRSEEHLRAVLDATDDSIYLVASDGILLDLNQTSLQRLNLDRENVIGRKIQEILPYAVTEKRMPFINQALSTGKKVSFEDSRDQRWMANHLYPIVEKNGRVSRLAIFSRDITERKNTADALILSETKYRLLADNVTDVIWVQDIASKAMSYISPSVKHLLGYSAGEIMEHGLEISMTSASIELLLLEIPNRIAGFMNGKREVFTDEIEHVHKNGNVVWVEVKSRILVNPESGLAEATGVARDITIQKGAQEELIASEQRFRKMIDISPVPIAINSGPEGKAYINQAFIETFGYSRDEIPTIFQWWERAYPDPAYREMVSGIWADKIEHVKVSGEKFIPMEVTVRCKDGTKKIMLATATQINSLDTESQLAVLYDITKLKQTEDDLRHALWRNESIIDGTQVGTWEWNIQTGKTVFNERWAQILGYSLKELSPTSINTWQQLAHPDDLKVSETLINMHFAVELPFYDFECRMKHKNGQWIWIHDRGRLRSRTPDGKPLVMFGTHTDITLRKQAELEIQNLNETLENRVAERTIQLENINKELEFHIKEIEQFTYIATHDLQEPLRTLKTFTNLVREEYAGILDEDGQQYITFISESAARMSALVKDLLDYSLLGKEGRFELSDCNEIVRDLLDTMEEDILSTKAQITVEELPIVTAYPVELKILFKNLIGNAIKFHRKDLSPEIKITALDQEKEWLFSIKDNGIGIDRKNTEKVFTIFRQMNKRSEFPGTGIGLAQVKKIVELHGARIWVESTPGKGSVFYFTIPKNQAL